MTNPLLDHLLNRRSVVTKMIEPPGPTPEEIEKIFTAGMRVPDHKALSPWRYILIEGEHRAQLGEKCADIWAAKNAASSQPLTGEKFEKEYQFEQHRFERSPVIICVVLSPVEHPQVPEWEQILSCGASAMNILHAAYAFGYQGQWITEWVAYDQQVESLLGLDATEKIVAFIYLGSQTQQPKERSRAQISEKVSFWHNS